MRHASSKAGPFFNMRRVAHWLLIQRAGSSQMRLPALKRWYQRAGQGFWQHIRFVSIHLLHSAECWWYSRASGNPRDALTCVPSSQGQASVLLTLGAGFDLVLAFPVVFFALVAPANAAFLVATPTSIPPNWMGLRTSWEIGHTIHLCFSWLRCFHEKAVKLFLKFISHFLGAAGSCFHPDSVCWSMF
jgi:hypothetical protein